MSTRQAQSRQERAAAAMAAQKRAERRRRNSIISAVAVVAVIALVAIGIAVQQSRSSSSAKGATPPGITAQNGFTVGQASAKAKVVVYLDYQCPVCKSFEENTGPTLDSLVQAGTAQVEYRPIAFLDRASTTNYSTRADNAAACAADAGQFQPYLKTLYSNQPEENSAGLPDSKLIDLGKSAGITSPDFASCVNNHTYTGWTARATDAASKAGVNGTPTVLVNGKTLQDRSPEALKAAVEAAAKS